MSQTRESARSQSSQSTVDWAPYFAKEDVIFDGETEENRQIRKIISRESAAGKTVTHALKELLINAIGSIEKKTLQVFCIARTAWHQNIFNAVTADVSQTALLSCLNSETKRGLNLHLNASRILDEYWGG